MKRFLSVVIAIGLLLSIWAVPAVAEGEHKSGLFTYELKGNGNAVITGFDWKENGENDIYVPRQIDGYSVTEIGAYAFAGEEVRHADEQGDAMGNTDETGGITAYLGRERHLIGSNVVVVLPDTITTIGAKAFFSTAINSVTIPASVQIIDSGAFAGCWNLTQHSVASDNSVYTTINGVLYNKTEKELVSIPGGYRNGGQEEFAIPDGIISVGEFAFAGVLFADKQKISIPGSVKQIKDYAFTGTEVYEIFGDSVTDIGAYAFDDSSLKYYSGEGKGWPFPRVKTIGDHAFESAFFSNMTKDTWDKNIVFPQSLQHIGEGAFMGFSSGIDAYSFDMSKTAITSVAKHAFRSCNVSGVRLPDTVKQIEEGAFANVGGVGIDSVIINIPASVETINSGAFQTVFPVSALSISFSEDSQLKRIGDYAFAGVQFTYGLGLPEGLESIGAGAFTSVNLNALNIPASVTEIGDDVCDRENTQLKVEPGSYAALYASENGYQVLNAGGEDTSWLNS